MGTLKRKRNELYRHTQGEPWLCILKRKRNELNRHTKGELKYVVQYTEMKTKRITDIGTPKRSLIVYTETTTKRQRNYKETTTELQTNYKGTTTNNNKTTM